MAEHGPYKNAEGYSDPTATEAIKGIAKPGEIWKYKGREVLIVKDQGGYCNILTLSQNPGKGNATIELAGRYTTPGKLNYAFNQDLAEKAGKLSEVELDNVLSEIEESLSLRPVISGRRGRMAIANAETENKKLQKKLEVLRGMYDDLLNRFLNKESEYV
jgi:hypothetical protein